MVNKSILSLSKVHFFAVIAVVICVVMLSVYTNSNNDDLSVFVNYTTDIYKMTHQRSDRIKMMGLFRKVDVTPVFFDQKMAMSRMIFTGHLFTVSAVLEKDSVIDHYKRSHYNFSMGQYYYTGEDFPPIDLEVDRDCLKESGKENLIQQISALIIEANKKSLRRLVKNYGSGLDDIFTSRFSRRINLKISGILSVGMLPKFARSCTVVMMSVSNVESYHQTINKEYKELLSLRIDSIDQWIDSFYVSSYQDSDLLIWI